MYPSGDKGRIVAPEEALLEELAWGLPDDDAFEAEEARLSFRAFIPYAWPIIRPGDAYIPSREVDAVAEHLEAVSRGHIQDLAINIRPRSTKSRVASVLWPVWDWLEDATGEFFGASFDLANAREYAAESRLLIESRWFQVRYGQRVRLRKDSRAKGLYATTAGGRRHITSPKSGTTGRGGKRLLLDDPHDTRKVESPKEREATITWWRKSFSNRSNNARRRSRVVLGQRTHHRDLFAHLREEGGWEWLVIPTEYREKKRRPPTKIGWEDPRRVEGELLANPERFGPEENARARIELGPADYSAQHDQEPTPEGGTTFRREDWRRWRLASASLTGGLLLTELDNHGHPVRVIPDPGVDGAGWRDYFDEQVQSWDFTFKGEADSDFVVGQAWGRKGGDFFLLHQVRERLDIHGTIAALLNLSALFPWAIAKYIEDAANGPAVLTLLNSKVPGMQPVSVANRGKPERARAIAPLQRAGNVFLPEDTHAHPWVPMYVERHAQFPRVDFDDEIDATSQALAKLYESVAKLLEAEALAAGYGAGEY